MDDSLVRSLNGWFSASATRADLARLVAILPLLAIIGLVVLAWVADWGRDPERRSILVIGVLGTILALALNIALGHLYYRPRPFLVLPIHALLPHPADSSLFSDHLAIAGAVTAALFVTRRWLGIVALALCLLLALGRVATGVQYPSDTLVGFATGFLSFVVLLPLRHPIARLLSPVSTAEASLRRRERRQDNFLFRHGPLVGAGLLVVAAVLGYGLRALQDHGRIEAGVRAEARLAVPPEPSPPAAYAAVPIATIAGGHYGATHASVVGDVTQVTRELDGDIHLRIEGGGAFIVAEIIPELPTAPPHIGQEVTAWGIVRHDGLHNWWELHPLIGWQPGNVAVQTSPGPGLGD